MLSFIFGRQPTRQTVREVLEAAGLSPEEVDAAEADGIDELLAIDQVVLPEALEYDIDELAETSGLQVEDIRGYWRALGFADPAPGERVFSEFDVEILQSVSEIQDGLTDPILSLQMTRVLGLSMARFAAAVVEAGEARSTGRHEAIIDGDAEVVAEYEASSLAVQSGNLLPFLTEVMEYAFRRHLRAAARRRITLANLPAGDGLTVGFADMVRFTKLSQQLDDHALARLVTQFDELTNEIVATNGGRIVKMIGDEAMFTAEAPDQAAHIALELAKVFGDRDDLPGVRVGLASGPVLARDGDVYGPVVNLASRLVEASKTDSVVVSQATRDQLVGDPTFKLRSLGSRHLRHIGTVRLYRLRTA